MLEALQAPRANDHPAIIEQIRAAYGEADRFLRVAPALSVSAFPR
ncbi:MAG: hypothetical protein U0361_05815 [Nitrospiraceae bacterium]